MSDQLRHEDLAAMSGNEITEALAAGRCANLLGAPSNAPTVDLAELEQAAENGTVDDLIRRHREKSETTRERLRHMTHEEIAAAFNRGEFDAFLRGEADQQ